MQRRRLGSASLEADESAKLNDELVCLLMGIERIYADLPKPTQIRIERWVDKISQPIVNVQWKKNANTYAALLLDMTRRGVLREPFDKNPPSGPLQTLPRYMTEVSEKVSVRTTKSAWVKAYERVVGHSLISSKPIDKMQRSSSMSWMQQDSRRPSTYVEMVNDIINQLEKDLEAERSTTAALNQQLKELQLKSKSQNDELTAAKSELVSAKVAHQRDLERIQMLHAVEVEELIKRHEQHLQSAILNNERTISAIRTQSQEAVIPASVDVNASLPDFLAFIDRFQEETVKLTQLQKSYISG
ncbi:hypothetical protein Ae201684P_007917 [Aphanomyces euteiches]|nr:hypothetical protein Ae201684P_007917 [Aphanomyces euteiches]